MLAIATRHHDVTRADHVPGPGQGAWTYRTYAEMPDDGYRYEVIGGVLYLMPAPSLRHQRCQGRCFLHLHQQVEATGLGLVIGAPFDIELALRDVVQPDVVVYLREHVSRLTETHGLGAPDLVVEVVSPSTRRHDRGRKLEAYRRSGVREIWFPDPQHRTIEVLALRGDVYASVGVFTGDNRLPAGVLPSFDLPADGFFPESSALAANAT